jgi:hypothetical protein
VGALRTSEETDEVVGGEAKQAKSDDNRKVDAPGQIIIDSVPIAPVSAAPPRPAAPVPKPMPQAIPKAPQRAGGLGLVIFVYILATAALGAAIYERFLM